MSELTIREVLEHYGATVNVPETGWHAIRCVFHSDSHASASVNIGQGLFVCHTCSVKGDAAAVVMKVEGLRYKEIDEWATALFGESRTVVSPAIPGQREPRKPKRRKWSGLPD